MLPTAKLITPASLALFDRQGRHQRTTPRVRTAASMYAFRLSVQCCHVLCRFQSKSCRHMWGKGGKVSKGHIAKNRECSLRTVKARRCCMWPHSCSGSKTPCWSSRWQSLAATKITIVCKGASATQVVKLCQTCPMRIDAKASQNPHLQSGH